MERTKENTVGLQKPRGQSVISQHHILEPALRKDWNHFKMVSLRPNLLIQKDTIVDSIENL